jgi:hypothetical protein
VKGKFFSMKISLVGYNFELICLLVLTKAGKVRCTIYRFSTQFFILFVASSQLVASHKSNPSSVSQGHVTGDNRCGEVPVEGDYDTPWLSGLWFNLAKLEGIALKAA